MYLRIKLTINILKGQIKLKRTWRFHSLQQCLLWPITKWHKQRIVPSNIVDGLIKRGWSKDSDYVKILKDYIEFQNEMVNDFIKQFH